LSVVSGESVAQHGGDIVDRLCELAEKAPDRLLFVELFDGVNETSRLTASALRDRASNLAGSLANSGVRPGDVVLMIATPPCEFLVGLMGCMWAGVIAAPIAFPRRLEHLTTRLEPVRANARAVAVVSAPARQAGEEKVLEELTQGSLPMVSTAAPASQRMAEPVAEREVAYLQYTSGSTSDPRGVIVTHRNLMSNLEVIHSMLDMDADSVNVSWCPLTHDMGLIMGALPSVSLGMLSILMPPGAFIRRPLTWLRAIDEYGGTHCYSPNFGYDLSVDRSTEDERAELDLSSMRVLVNAAEPVRRHTRDRFLDAFAPSGLSREAHTPAYGLAEATVLVSAVPGDTPGRVVTVDAAALERHELIFSTGEGGQTRELCTDGVIGAGFDARIVDPVTCEELTAGRIGELWLRGPSVSPGYWRRPEMTEETFGGMTSKGDGPFLRTGDLGFMSEGEFVICGRAKDLIVIHGRNLYPQDIELAAEFAHEAVRSGGTAAFSIDDGGHERLVVVAEVNGEPDEDEVHRAVTSAVLREFELNVEDVLLVEPFKVPKTASGKKQRSATRRLWSDARARKDAAAH
jgi:acyl-CoA synthetase (AMP-forming)/AMP-acid ligase II